MHWIQPFLLFCLLSTFVDETSAIGGARWRKNRRMPHQKEAVVETVASYPYSLQRLLSSLQGIQGTCLGWYQNVLVATSHVWRDIEEEGKATVCLLTIMIICFAGFLLVFYCFIRRQAWMEKRYGTPVMTNPPQGRAWPFGLGQAVNFLRYRPWDLLTQWHTLYGPIVCFQLLGATFFSLGSPALIKQALQSKVAAVKKDIANTMKPFLCILGTGIVTSEDDAWFQQRLKMSHPLRQDVLELIPRQTLLAVQRLMETTLDPACHTGQAIPVGSSLRHLTLQVISGTFLSLSADESDSTFAKYYLPIVDESNHRVWHPYRRFLFFLPAFWSHWYSVYCLNQYVSRLIRERWALRRREEQDTKTIPPRQVDILDRVMLAYERDHPDPTAMPSVLPESQVRQWRDEMKTFMLAGHETSAAMMTWAVYELLGNPLLMQRVVNEGQAIFGTSFNAVQARPSDLPPADKLAELIVCEATLKVKDRLLM